MKHKVLCFLTILLFFLGLQNSVKIIANEWTVDRVENLVDGLIAYNEKENSVSDAQKWVDDIMVTAPEAYEWYAFGLSRYKEPLYFDKYVRSLSDYLNNNTVKNAASRCKYALVLIAVGDSHNTYITKTAEEVLNEQGIMSLVFELHLLNNIDFNDSENNRIIDSLLERQLTDGGFAVSGDHGDVDVTAMTIQALSTFYDINDDVKLSIDRALDFLSERQEPSGDFKSYGQCNPESASQVLTALCSLGIDPASDDRFIKNGNTVMDGIERFKLDNNSYSHITDGPYNRNATIQAFYSYIALWRMYSGKAPLYRLKEVTTEITPTESISDIDEGNSAIVATEHLNNTNQENLNEEKTEDILILSETNKHSEAAAVTSKLNGLSYKYIALSVILLLTAFAMGLLTILKKRNYKNYIFTAVLAIIAVLVVFTTNIQSKEDYYSNEVTHGETIGKVSIEIRCDSVLNKLKEDSEFNPVILDASEYGFSEGDSCYDILVKACKDNKIPIDTKGSAGMIYVSGINLMYEFDYGDLSGWMYFVNGEELSVSCDSCKVKNGDVIQFLYTCELGKDLKH